MFSKEKVWYLFSVLLRKWWQCRLLLFTPAVNSRSWQNYLKCLDSETRVAMSTPDSTAYSTRRASLSAWSNQNSLKATGTTPCAKWKRTRQIPGKLHAMGLTVGRNCANIRPLIRFRMQLKMLSRQQSLYTKIKTMIKNNPIALLDQIYPSIDNLF